MIDSTRGVILRSFQMFVLVLVFSTESQAAELVAPTTGPETEKRFPPLKVPEGFTATLFACDPLIEYPSVIALGPRQGTLFVVHDYMTGLGTEIVRRDEIRLVTDTDGDGYADKTTLFAGEFNSIMGLAYDRGALYVGHAPFLTVLRDTDGDDVADERRDVLAGLGLTPKDNPVRLHCLNGVTMGHDGWLYLALGDHGCDVKRPEGDRLVYEGGGILRCRPDGTGLHLFASGLRNIYDVALDADLNVFVRDNENDGGDYMIRVCHSFFGADHGYPYDYYERPYQAMKPIADLGRGSSAGGLCYLETAFPKSSRGNLFFGEWGRSVVRYPLARSGSGFAETHEIDFAFADDTDPYGFRPTSLVVDYDGSILVSDWADGQRPKRGRGRVYRIRYGVAAAESLDATASSDSGLDVWISQLDSPSHHARLVAQAMVEGVGEPALSTIRARILHGGLGVLGQLHAVWVIARLGGAKSIDELLRLASTTPSSRVATQAVRAVADLVDPVFVTGQLDAVRGDETIAQRLAKLATQASPDVLREVVVTLGRLRWKRLPIWLSETLGSPVALDPALEHAGSQALRRADNWPAVLQLLDAPDTGAVRLLALRAAADQSKVEVVDGLLRRLSGESSAERRRDYAHLLARVYKRPAPWTYWGYRPKPRPPSTLAWERTEAIERALGALLDEPEPSLRVFVLKHMMREGVPVSRVRLATWLREKREPKTTVMLLEALANLSAAAGRDTLVEVIRDSSRPGAARLQAIDLAAPLFDSDSEAQLLDTTRHVEEGSVLVALLGQLAEHPALDSRAEILRRLESSDAGVRSAALAALAKLELDVDERVLIDLFDDVDPSVRRAAVVAAGQLGSHAAADPLLAMVRDPDTDAETQAAIFDALAELGDTRAIPGGLKVLREGARPLAALNYLGSVGSASQALAIVDFVKTQRSVEVLSRAIGVLNTWHKRATEPTVRSETLWALAAVQGASGTLSYWQITSPLAPSKADAQAAALGAKRLSEFVTAVEWESHLASGAESRVRLGNSDSTEAAVSLAYTEVVVEAPVAVEFLGASRGTLRVDINGSSVYTRGEPSRFRPFADRFSTRLRSGLNRVLVRVANAGGGTQFQLRFRLKSTTERHERLTSLALSGAGTIDGGREVFYNQDKSQCLKCHRLGEQGGKIGPDLTGIGGRFSRVHVIESILDPSRTIAASFHSVTVVLTDGQVISGIKVQETESELVIGDNQGTTHVLSKSTIAAFDPQPISTMPEGLEKQFTDLEFADLISFLMAQR